MLDPRRKTSLKTALFRRDSLGLSSSVSVARRFWRRFKACGASPERSESGQGVVEYILLLVIILILALGLAYQFNTAFRTWAAGFFDGYVACLLETGELPGVSELCREEYANFDANSGQRLADGNFGSGDGAGGGGGDNNSRNQGGGDGGGEALVSGGSSRIGFARVGDRGRQATTRVGTAGEEREGGSQSQFGAMNTPMGRVNQNTSRRETVTMTYQMGGEAEREKETRPTAAKAGKVDEGGADALRPGRAIDTSQSERSISSVSEQTSFSVGGFIRLLIIICIIIAMVVFFGGQLLQIAKSREKGGD